MPTVAIVGRPNVGKSALFNRLAKRKIAIVHDQPGVTRDRISAPCMATEIPCTLIDTGGIGGTLEDGFAEAVTIEADIAMQTADLILFVVDAQTGLTPVDLDLGGKLRKAKPPVMLVVNKVDEDKHTKNADEFSRLGFGEAVRVSAEHGKGMQFLTEKIDEFMKPIVGEIEEAAAIAEETGIKLAIIGKPNAGKSSLVNAILQDQRTIVSDIAGTTRDRIEVPVAIGGVPFLLTDTAGLRDETNDSVEAIGIARARDAVEAADIILWLGDPTTPPRADAILVVAQADRLSSPLTVPGTLPLSAMTGQGMDALHSELLARAKRLLPAEGDYALQARQRNAAGTLHHHLLAAAETGDLLILAEELRASRGAIDRLTGRAGTEDMLDTLFSGFCIGK